jgi:hypothetical protein
MALKLSRTCCFRLSRQIPTAKVCFGSKGDIGLRPGHVRFTRKNRHRRPQARWRLWARSGLCSRCRPHRPSKKHSPLPRSKRVRNDPHAHKWRCMRSHLPPEHRHPVRRPDFFGTPAVRQSSSLSPISKVPKARSATSDATCSAEAIASRSSPPPLPTFTRSPAARSGKISAATNC